MSGAAAAVTATIAEAVLLALLLSGVLVPTVDVKVIGPEAGALNVSVVPVLCPVVSAVGNPVMVTRPVALLYEQDAGAVQLTAPAPNPAGTETLYVIPPASSGPLLRKVTGTLSELPPTTEAGGEIAVVTSVVVAPLTTEVLPDALLLAVVDSEVAVAIVASTWTLPLLGAV